MPPNGLQQSRRVAAGETPIQGRGRYAIRFLSPNASAQEFNLQVVGS